MKHSGESVVGCGYSGVPKPEYGRITAKEDCLYYHVMEAQIGGIPLRGISRETIEEITLLKDGRKMEIEDTWITGNYPDLVFVSFGEDPRLPDPIDTVIKVKRKKNKQ
jgi:alpha-L-fucosidase